VPAVNVQDRQLVVELSSWERFAAMRGGVSIPLSAVQSAAVEFDPWSALRGIRAPGTGWPGQIAYGVWRWTATARRSASGEGRDFVAVRGRRPAVRIDLTPGLLFARLLVTVTDPDATVAAVLGSTAPH
jgi:hypothetical protein